MHSKRAEFWGGVRAQLPILLGVAPFGMIYGILAADAGLPVEVALGMSLIVFAGSSQFIAAQLFATGTPGLVIVLTTGIVNLRHMLYSASVAPHIRHLSRAWKYLLAFLLTDEAYAVTITHYDKNPHPPARETNRHWYFFGAGIALWTTWQISTAIGFVLGEGVPESWSLDFTLALTFIALLIPVMTDRPAILAAGSAGVTALIGNGLPYNLGLILAVLVGIAVGVLADRRTTVPVLEDVARSPSQR